MRPLKKAKLGRVTVKSSSDALRRERFAALKLIIPHHPGFMYTFYPQSTISSQESGIRSQKSEVRSQESGVRSQEIEVRSQESGIRNQESLTGLSFARGIATI